MLTVKYFFLFLFFLFFVFFLIYKIIILRLWLCGCACVRIFIFFWVECFINMNVINRPCLSEYEFLRLLALAAICLLLIAKKTVANTASTRQVNICFVYFIFLSFVYFYLRFLLYLRWPEICIFPFCNNLTRFSISKTS